MLRHPGVKAEIMRLDPRHAGDQVGVDAAWLLGELANLWDTPLDVLFDDSGSLRPLRAIPLEAQKLISGFEITTTTIGAGDGDSGLSMSTVGKVKLVDRLAVLRDIGKHVDVGAFQRNAGEDVSESLAGLLRAATKAIERSDDNTSEAIDVTPDQETEDGIGQTDE